MLYHVVVLLNPIARGQVFAWSMSMVQEYVERQI